MSVATELRAPVKPASATRTILGPAGNRVRSSEEESKHKKEGALKNTPEKPKRSNSDTPVRAIAVQSKNNVNIPSANNSFLSDSSGGVMGEKKIKKVGRREKGNDGTPSTVKASPEDAKLSSLAIVPLKRCDWITPYSDPLYSSFHDGEWGVPVYDDRKLFELFVLSIALAELTWPAILYKRDAFRNHFDNFDPSSIAKFTEQKLSVRANCSTLLSEPKLRAVVENANQLLKVQQEFGSFSNYCWKFVNHKPIRNGFRYARQVPAKTPKSDLISKDLMQRGFRCVGPTVVYSFMQVSGMVNDHLITCFRYHECSNNLEHDLKIMIEEKKVPASSYQTEGFS